MKTAASIIMIITGVLLVQLEAGWTQEYSFTYTCDNQGEVIAPDGMADFTTLLANTGTSVDTYRVVIDNDLPAGWFSQGCFRWGCFFDSVLVEMVPAAMETITVDIWPHDSTGAGTVTMRIHSLGDPGQTAAIPLTAITDTGVDVLIVDDDGTEEYESYYQAALDGAAKSHGTLDNLTTLIDADMMVPFSAVVWFTGEATPVLTAEDRQAISDYLEGGGRLFISGQDIASALCDPASGESDSSTVEWFEDIFLGQYLGEYDGSSLLEGFEGHPISDGLALDIAGGDGANNQIKPDILESFGGIEWVPIPSPLFIYTDGNLEASSALDEFLVGYKLVYFAFGFEAINNATDRAVVMERIMDWLMSPTPVEEQVEMATHPHDFSLSPNYPNPFNAATTFALYVPGEVSVPVSLKIYNILGQKVRTLMNGSLSPGSHLVLWDGKDEAGVYLASGVYFSRMESGNFSQIRKIVLTR